MPVTSKAPAPKAQLPIDDVLPDVLTALARHPNLALTAPTGAGKTTRVPPALLDAGLAGPRKVVMLEPRRMAARAAARRIAEERGAEIGQEVGYRMRFERREGPRTRILVVTQGVLLALLQQDPFLEDIGVVIFDEIHERSLESDLALAMCRRTQREAREDLHLVAMSATLDAAPLAAFLGDCPIVESAGRLYPVEIRHLETPPGERDARHSDALVAAGVRRLLRDPAVDGDLLAFLPGVGEIQRAAKRLDDLDNVDVLRLYGDLPSNEQDRALRRGRRRRIVLATNVAETSVTVDGVAAVVDSGLARELRFDPATGLDRLELRRISRASAEQRAGRAGRQGPGVCLRLWTRHDELSLPERTTPEILRVDLAGPALQLLAWGESDLDAFGWLEPPPAESLARALELLTDLGARDRHGLSAIGHAMARMPAHPRLARLLVAGAASGQLERASRLAALLTEREIVLRDSAPREALYTSPSDLLDRLEALERFDATGRIDAPFGDLHRGRARRVFQVAKQLERIGRQRVDGRHSSPASDDLLEALLAAYPDRLVRRRGGSDRGVMVGGRGVRLLPSSAVRDAELFLAIEVDGGASAEARVRKASAVRHEWLPVDAIREIDGVIFDPERQRVVGRRQTFYRDLVLASRDVPPDPTEAESVLAEAAARDPEATLSLEDPDTSTFLARLRSLAGWMPELDLPTFGKTELADILPVLCQGKRSFAELRRVPLVPMLRGLLTPNQLGALERHAPERFEVPSGSRIRLAYTPGEAPVLAARIQELFGLRETPRVASGRVPVLLHLLAPNHRPQQITDDLKSFWRRTYPEVRKELRARYPRHAWPEDPLRAVAERRPRRRQ